MLVADLLDKMSVENEPTESHLGSVGGRKDAERTKNQALKQLLGADSNCQDASHFSPGKRNKCQSTN